MKYTIPIEGRDTYGTHVHVLEVVLSELTGPINVFEFGCGEFSTLTFLNCDKVKIVSCIEMQSAEWADKIKEITKGDRITIQYLEKPFAVLVVAGIALSIYPYDLVFVDGHEDNRPECVNICFKAGIPIIIAHDFESLNYGWERVNMPDDYSNTIHTHESGKQTVIFKRFT